MNMLRAAVRLLITLSRNKPAWILDYDEKTRLVMEDIISEDNILDRELKKVKQEYYKSDYYKRLEEFKKEIKDAEPEFVKTAKVDYLRNKIVMLENEIKRIHYDYEQARIKGVAYIARQFFYLLSPIKQYEKELKSCKFQLRIITENVSDDKIDDYMILKAKDFPIERLLGIDKKNFAKCLWHDDSQPSMYLKNNYAYCFSCGHSADVIDIVMKLYKTNFIETVKLLNKGEFQQNCQKTTHGT